MLPVEGTTVISARRRTGNAGYQGVDLTDLAALRTLIGAVRPRLIVNAAAHTAVDRAEDEPDLARRINALVPRVLVEEAARQGAGIVHFSTDYVFAGDSRVPYTETDEPQPLGVYGQTKLAGEAELLHGGVPALVFRTSWMYSAQGKNFLLTMLAKAADGATLRIVDDQIGSPTAAGAVAAAATQIIARCLRHGPAWMAAHRGLYHMAAAGRCSWYGFAEAIFARTDAQPASLRPIPSAEYPSRAKRPAFSVLDCTKLEAAFGIRMAPWQVELDNVIAVLQKHLPRSLYGIGAGAGCS